MFDYIKEIFLKTFFSSYSLQRDSKYAKFASEVNTKKPTIKPKHQDFWSGPIGGKRAKFLERKIMLFQKIF